MLQSPGAISFEYGPPTPDQEESVAIARFTTVDALRVWRHSATNAALIDEAKPLVDGGVVMQLTGKAALEYYVQHSATEVIITQIKPGNEAAYRAFADRIQKVQETFPGYLGSFVRAAAPQGDRLDDGAPLRLGRHLEAWLSSTERAALLEEADPLIEGFHAQRVDTSFPGWVPADPATGRPPNMWKTASLVLLTLFPVVMLELKISEPASCGSRISASLLTFIGNAISVALTTWPLMPLAIRVFRPWLFPEDNRVARHRDALYPHSLLRDRNRRAVALCSSKDSCMNLNTVTDVKRPRSLDEIEGWRSGNAWLAGGTWLFSEPQVDVHTLIDLESLQWPSLPVDRRRPGDRRDVQGRGARRTSNGAARLDGGAAVRRVLPVVSFLVQDLERGDGRRKHLHVAAGGPDDLADGCARGRCHALAADGEPRRVPAVDFVTGNHQNVLAPGELLRIILLPARALQEALPSGGSRSRISGDPTSC